MARAYPACVHLRCGTAYALPCCHGKTRNLEGNRIAELPPQIFDKNIKLESLYVCLLMRKRPWWNKVLPCTFSSRSSEPGFGP